MKYGIRLRRPWWPKGKWKRGEQFRRASTPSGWTFWRDEWPNRKAAELRLNVYRAMGWRGHTFEIDELVLVTRDQWGARPPRNSPTVDDWSDAPLVWHHTADTFTSTSRAASIDHMRAMQYFHQNVRGWSDVGYNFIVFPNGDVFVGRGFGVRGAGAADPPREWNRNHIHVAFAGTFSDREPTPAAQRAADLLVADLRRRGARVPREVGHGDLMPTACPERGVRKARGL